MRKRVKVAFVVVLLGIVGLIVWELLRAREPVYDGKPVSYWINRYGQNRDGDVVILGEFVGDSNAVPFLVKALQRREGPLGALYLRTWPGLPDWMKRRLPTPFIAMLVRAGCAVSLGQLGAVAKPAVPALIRALKTDEESMVRAAAATALGCAGKGDSIVSAALVEALRDRDHEVRSTAAQALALADAHSKEAVAGLVKSLHDQVHGVRGEATNALVKLDPGSAAEAGVNTNMPPVEPPGPPPAADLSNPARE